MTRLIIPNLHAILIHFPLGLFAIGITIELLSFLWRRSSLRVAGRWMILLGALAMIPAVTTGIGAMADVLGHGQQGDQTWIKLKDGSGFVSFDWKVLRYHIWLNGIAAGLSLLAVVMWVAASDAGRRMLYFPAMLMLLIASGLLVDGAWHGGEMVYREGFGVEGRKPTSLTDISPVPPDSQPKSLDDKVQAVIPPFDVHLLMAGLVISASALALAVTLRRSATLRVVFVPHVEKPVIMEALPERNSGPISLMGALHDPEEAIVVPPVFPTARLWLLAAAITVLALVTGLWFGGFIVGGSKIINIEGLRGAIERMNTNPDDRRMGLHIVMGGSILLLALLLAMLARFTPRSRVVLGGMSMLLTAVIAAQVWTGILMLFDSGQGPINRFKNAVDLQRLEETDSGESAPAIAATMPSTMP